jgi:REP element-mobilizing transposase RayT
MDEPVRYFDPYADILQGANRLPHWEQSGASYFVTWRLADALPAFLLVQWSAERTVWLKRHPQPWTAEFEREYHRRFTGAMERWLDAGYGSCLLRKPGNGEIVSNALHHFDGVRYLLISAVVMPNHVHVLFSLHREHGLKAVIQGWKGYTARVINQRRGCRGTVWARDYFDRLIRDTDHFTNCVRHIRRNPIKARLRPGSFVLNENDLARTID